MQRPRHKSVAAILELSKSPSVADRAAALQLMRSQLLNGKPKAYLDIARKLVNVRSSRIRWQAVIVVGEFIDTEPEKVWNTLLANVSTNSSDLASALATVLLEHMLEKQYSFTVRRLRSELRSGNWRWARLLEECWLFGSAVRHRKEIERLTMDFKRAVPAAKARA